EGGGNAAGRAELVRRLAGVLTESILADERTRHLGETLLPSREAVAELVDLLRSLTFPGFFGRRDLTRENLPMRVEELLSRIAAHTEEQVRSALRYARHMGHDSERPDGADEEADCAQRARRITEEFLGQIPEIRR